MAGGPNTVPVRPDLANVSSDLLALRLFCVSPETKKASSFRSAPEGCDDHLSRRASAAGKTTLSHEIAVRTGAAVIAEVWALFGRPSPEPPLWYLEKQVERGRFARKSAEKHGLAILDGDPFQPLWYGWAYGFIEPHTLSTVTSFYAHQAIIQSAGNASTMSSST